MIRPKRTGAVRAPYTPQACGVCRHKKIRCTGERPVCQTCETSGHASDCSWGPEQTKRTITRDFVKSLRKRIEDQDNYISFLLRKLDQCRNEHGGVAEDYLQLRPTFPMPEDEEPDFDPNVSDNEDGLAEKMRAFHLEGQELQWYGKVSIFQYAPTVPGNLSRFPAIVEDASRCYVLLVDGADTSKYNPDFDWSRHLPSEVYLERREHDRLLDLLFKFFTSWCLRIVPALFLRDMYRALCLPPSQTPHKTTHYSPMLHNALVALATAFSDNPRLRNIRSRQLFVKKAKSYIDAECHNPNISVVHALSIIGSFHSSMGDQTLGYLYFGMSGRLSQALGLGIDCSPWVKENFITHDDMLDRNWAHWTTFAQDVCWSLYVGREFCVAPPSDQSVIPVPFVDSEFDQIPWHYPPSGIAPQPNYLSSTFAATCELLRIGRRIMEVVNVLSNPGTRQDVSNEMISKLDKQLHAWKAGLPPEVGITLLNRNTATPHQIMLELAFWWLFILLHRPFYRRHRPTSDSEKDIDHVELCDRAARNIMELVGTWRSLYTLRYVPITFIQVVFSAGTVFVLSAIRTSSGLRSADLSFSHSLAQAELCIQYLLETGRSFQCANHIAGILGNLLQGELKSRVLDKTAATPGLVLSGGGSSSGVHNSSNNPLQPVWHATGPSTSGSSSVSSEELQPPKPLYHIWDLNKSAQGPVGQQQDSYDLWSNTHSLVGTSSFGLGLGMRGGDTLSNRPFEPSQFNGNQLESQLGVFANEEPQETLVLTDEEIAALVQALSQEYPQSPLMN